MNLEQMFKLGISSKLNRISNTCLDGVLHITQRQGFVLITAQDYTGVYYWVHDEDVPLSDGFSFGSAWHEDPKARAEEFINYQSKVNAWRVSQ